MTHDNLQTLLELNMYLNSDFFEFLASSIKNVWSSSLILICGTIYLYQEHRYECVFRFLSKHD